MKVNELRIGNWVKVGELMSGSEFPNAMFQWSTGHFYDLEQGVLFMNDVHPIPLTPEILEQCGFRMSITKTCYGLITESGKMRLSVFTNGLFKIGTEDIESNVQYLHQLQNLFFALTGTELSFSPKPSNDE